MEGSRGCGRRVKILPDLVKNSSDTHPTRMELAELGYSFEARTERLISAGRVVLASFSLFAIWLDPSEPAKYATLAYFAFAAYLVYSLGIALLVWRSYRPLLRLGLVTHVLDMGIFVLFMYFTEGPTSPFFVYFIFSILCASLRWQWRGTLSTAAVLLPAFLGMGVYAGEVLRDPQFELNRFIIRSVYLGVVTILLGYLGAHEFQRRKQLGRLAAWSRQPANAGGDGIARLLEHAAGILAAPRVVLAWEEREEPWLNLATFADGRFELTRRPPGSLRPLVAEPLDGKSFFSQDLRHSIAVVIDSASSEVRRWRGDALHHDLEKLLEARSVLSVGVRGENFDGRLFVLDKSLLGSDDLVLAEVVASQTAASMNLHYFSLHLQREAAMEERMRLARDLHDGVLQSLTAAALQLQTVLQVSETEPGKTRERLRRIQDLIIKEQSDLRSFVEELRLAPPAPEELDFKLAHHLEELARALEQQWNLRVEIELRGPEAQVPAAVAREIYRLVREGLVNAARHSGASVTRAELDVQDHRVRIDISDNGRGFSFRGRFDQDDLAAMAAGPITLKSRVASLGGSLSIHSTESGAQLEIEVPLSSHGA